MQSEDQVSEFWEKIQWSRKYSEVYISIDLTSKLAIYTFLFVITLTQDRNPKLKNIGDAILASETRTNYKYVVESIENFSANRTERWMEN